MKHFFIAHADYACSGMLFARALESVGQEIRTLAQRAQKTFQYPVQMERINHPAPFMYRALECMEWADCITVVQSELPGYIGGRFPLRPGTRIQSPWKQCLSHKKTVVTHGGSYYRQNKERYKHYWEGIADAHICHSADLMGVMEREHLFLPPADPKLIPKKRDNKRLVVGHFPSRPKGKGSADIIPAMERFNVDFRCEVKNPTSKRGPHRVPWERQIERMSECDVIIDQIQPMENNQVFGEWCSIAIEAAALGCIVITNSHNLQPYIDTYGCAPNIRVCNDKDDLYWEIERLVGLTRVEICQEQEETREWVEKYHSLEATGHRLMSRVYGSL